MQKTRRLMAENSVSFQILLILLSFNTIGSERQISVFKDCQSNIQMSVFWGGKACAEAKIWRYNVLKRLHKALRSVQFLASFIGFYFEILSYLACGEKNI